MLQFPWTDTNKYKAWLAQSYYYTSYSTRMLAYAAGSTSTEQVEYYRRSIHHIREESGHEKLAQSDLVKLGGHTNQYPELGITRSIWETQFYKIQKNPVALLGYILALELLAVKTLPSINKTLLEVYEDANMFVKVHAEEDPSHVEEAIKQIEMLDAKDKTVALENFNQTCELYELMLDRINQATPSSVHS